LDRGSLITGGCPATREAEAKRGTIARIVVSEKCILVRRDEGLSYWGATRRSVFAAKGGTSVGTFIEEI